MVYKTLYTKEELILLLQAYENPVLIGHNIIQYDIPLLEKLWGIVLDRYRVIDTLVLSFYLFPFRGHKHGLESYGKRFGLSKIAIDDWKSGDMSLYAKRCECDVAINAKLLSVQLKTLYALYGNWDDIVRIANYLAFKMQCLREQNAVGIKLDTRRTEFMQHTLQFELLQKEYILARHMPYELVYEKPKKLYCRNGELSRAGEMWFSTLQKYNLPADSDGIYKLGNPGSNKQVKDWLFALGWKPEKFKVGSNGSNVPQIVDQDGYACSSIQKMYDKYPYLKELEDFGLLKHRLGLLKSYMNCMDENGRVYATAYGLTSTLRFQHKKPIVNLPGTDKPYGMEVRGLLQASDAHHTMIGADISGLEDSTKRHYIYFFDPDYVNEMQQEDFDAHIDIALLANLITPEEAEFYKNFKDGDDAERYNAIKAKRYIAKQGNFSCTYGAGVSKIREIIRSDRQTAQHLYDVYWKRNWAIKRVEQSIQQKDIILPFYGATTWVKNPVSGFWLNLRSQKDIFSAINQSTGVYVFDAWLRNTIRLRESSKTPFSIVLQYHDEMLIECETRFEGDVKALLQRAIALTNNELKLNVKIGISVETGKNYAECH